MNKERILLRHLVNLVKLCNSPKDTWDEEDRKNLQEARDYLQEHGGLEDLGETKE